jgi:hypothetical protein
MTMPLEVALPCELASQQPREWRTYPKWSYLESELTLRQFPYLSAVGKSIPSGRKETIHQVGQETHKAWRTVLICKVQF